MDRPISLMIRLFTVIVASGALAVAAAPPTIKLINRAVEIGGLAPYGSAVLFGISRESNRVGGVTVRFTRIAVDDADGDGRAHFPSTFDIPLRSVWVAVDLDSGDYAVAGPPDNPARIRRVDAASLKKGSDAGFAVLEDERSRLALLLVRPQKGAWYQLGTEGGASDADGDRGNGKLTLAFENAVPLGRKTTSNAPKHVTKDDVLVGIDPGRLDVFILRVDK